MTKNVKSGKLKGFDLSYLEAKFATPENPERASQKNCETFYIQFLGKFFLYLSSGKIPITLNLENYKNLSSHNQRQDSQQLRVP